MKAAIVVLLMAFFFSSSAQEKVYQEEYRPRFHFSPPENWCNDPNGLVYNKGLYHLFYQFNPFGNVWGHMTWAHAISRDLIHWSNLPDAISEEDSIMAFSGSCVVDRENSSGFSTSNHAPMVAAYTAHRENLNQSQALAYSLDDGLTWMKYKNNPVLDLHKKDFRDPKVSWYAKGKFWLMAVMMPNEHIVQFYNSKDLKTWNHLSDFGPAGDTAAVWECPDLTEVTIENSADKKWVLQTSQNAGMQYFVGEFDGTKFINETKNVILRPDYGTDYYAAVSFNNLPLKAEPVSIGWLNNWNYANDIPTTPWKGAMSLPRNFHLKEIAGSLTLVQQPVKTINTLRYDLKKIGGMTVAKTNKLALRGDQYEISFELQPGKESTAGIRIAMGENEYFEIGYNNLTHSAYTDRSHSSRTFKNKSFEKLAHSEQVIAQQGNKVQFDIFYDHSIVEVFINGGSLVFTSQIFPQKGHDEIAFFNSNKPSVFSNISFWKMRSIW